MMKKEVKMAAIDKIYGTNKQYDEFKDWCKENAFWMLDFFYEKDDCRGNSRPITNTPVYADVWLWKNCNLHFVKTQLESMYAGVPEIEKNEVFFIEKIVPFIYSDIYEKGFEYFVKPGDDNTIYCISYGGYENTPLTVSDITEGK